MEELKSIDLAEWTKVGEGGNGSTFSNPAWPDVLLKVNRPRVNTRAIIEHEYEVSRAVEDLGLSTPRTLETVRVGDLFGLISECLPGKRSLSRICCDEPSRTEEMARVLCSEGRKIFETPCPPGRFPSRKEQLLNAVDKVAFLSKGKKKAIRAFAATIPENGNCIHGDFQMGNLVNSGGRHYWIDLDRFAHGDPMFDIGHLFLLCMVYSPMKKVQELCHMNLDQFRRFWEAFATDYTGKEDHSGFDALAGKFALLDMIIRYNFERPTFAQNIFFRIVARRIFKQYYK